MNLSQNAFQERGGEDIAGALGKASYVYNHMYMSPHDILIDVSMSLRQRDLFILILTYWMFSKLGTYQGNSTFKVFVYSRSPLYACFRFPIYMIPLLENNQGYKLQCIDISSCTWLVCPVNIHCIQALNKNIFKNCWVSFYAELGRILRSSHFCTRD